MCERSKRVNAVYLSVFVIALIMAVLFVFGSEFSILMGAGWFAFQIIVMTTVLVCAACIGNLKWNKSGVIMMICAFGMSYCFLRFADKTLRLMNILPFAASMILSLMSLTGKKTGSVFKFTAVKTGIRFFLTGLFANIKKPVASVRNIRSDKNAKPSGVLIGLALALPVTMIAIILMICADMEFAGLFKDALTNIQNTDIILVLIKIILSLLLGFMLFSYMFSHFTQNQIAEPGKRKAEPLPGFVNMIMLPLVILYGIFCYIQFKCLFGGVETVKMKGGYAEYARSGFFELTLLTLLTLGILLLGIRLNGGKRFSKVLGTILAAMTYVIAVSSLMRLTLYVQVYGLTLLRVLTVYAILNIMLALAACIVKTWKTDFCFDKVVIAAVLLSWIGLNHMNIDARIAQYNVSAYNNGKLESLDTDYLVFSLSQDVKPALKSIKDEQQRDKAMEKYTLRYGTADESIYDWSIACLIK